jgi:hypothetical protein
MTTWTGIGILVRNVRPMLDEPFALSGTPPNSDRDHRQPCNGISAAPAEHSIHKQAAQQTCGQVSAKARLPGSLQRGSWRRLPATTQACRKDTIIGPISTIIVRDAAPPEGWAQRFTPTRARFPISLNVKRKVNRKRRTGISSSGALAACRRPRVNETTTAGS